MRVSIRQFSVAMAIGLAAGFLLCGYEFIRSTSSSLFIGAFGAGALPYAMLAGSILTLVLLFGYGWVLTWLGPRRTLFYSTAMALVVIVGGYWAQIGGLWLAPGILYAFREAYIVILVEQYWSFIDSAFQEGEAKRLNGFICGLGSLGAIGGGYAVGTLARSTSALFIGTENILLLAAISLLPAALLSDLAYRVKGEPTPAPKERASHTSLALRLFSDSSYLRRIFLLILLTQVVSTALDLRFSALVEVAKPLKDARTAFFGNFYAQLNMVAGLLQFIGAPLLLSWVRLRWIHLGIPLIHMAAAVVLLVHPVLWAGGLAYVLFKALDYSLFRAGKEIFYIPLSFDCRYRAKEVIDAFGYRAAKGVASGLATVAANIGGKALPVVVYPAAVLVCAAAWLAAVSGVVREYERKTGARSGGDAESGV